MRLVLKLLEVEDLAVAINVRENVKVFFSLKPFVAPVKADGVCYRHHLVHVEVQFLFGSLCKCKHVVFSSHSLVHSHSKRSTQTQLFIIMSN
jgi:hypothetical protein